MVNSGAPALGSAPVATNAIPTTEAVEGRVVMDVVVVAVGTPTVTSAVNGCPEAGDCSIHPEGNLRNSESPNDDLSRRRAGIPDGMSDAGT